MTNTELNYFYFKKCGAEQYLLTNDMGNYVFLDEGDFICLRDSLPDISTKAFTTLCEEGFIITEEKKAALIRAFRQKNHFLEQGPSLHIVVVTLRCDHKCIYCQTGSKPLEASGYDMDRETAERTVDFILESSSNDICIEFQGGEPLVNFDIVRHIINYTERKGSTKNIIFSLVTNMTFMDPEKMAYLLDHGVSICTSLDGPEEIHNKHRICRGQNSFQNTVSWIRRILEAQEQKEKDGKKFGRTNALLTVSRDHLDDWQSVIELYHDLGFHTIHLRPINPFGFGKRLDTCQIYTSEEFVDFYRKALDYIIAKNSPGRIFYEQTAKMILQKIILKRDANFLDLRSPCGAGIGQLAYNYDGDIFTCDEARMVSHAGDRTFFLGNVAATTYEAVIRSDVVRNLCIASCLEGLPGCHDCVYHPFCGVCPVYNHVEQGSIFGHMSSNERCRILMGIQDHLFLRLKDHYDLFTRWANSW